MITEQTADRVVFTDGYRTLVVDHYPDSFAMTVEVAGKSRKIVLQPAGAGVEFGFTREDGLDPAIGSLCLHYVDSDEPRNDPLYDNNPLVVINSPGAGDAIAHIHVTPTQPVVTFERGVKQIATHDKLPVYGYPPEKS